MTRKSFVLYIDLLGALDDLTDAQAGKLFKAIKAYHMSVSEGATQDCKAEFDSLMNDFVTKLAFHPFKASFERDSEKYQSIVTRNRENGKKGGRKKAVTENPVGSLGFSENPKEPKQTQKSHNDNDNDNDNDNEIISPDGDKPAEPVPRSLFEGEEKKAKKRKTPPRPKPPEPPPPTLEEIKTYFLSQRADERLADWEREAEAFFYHFTSLGWRTSAGGKIPHWDSRANLWILENEKSKKPEKPITDETGQADRLSERRGTESGAKSRKGFKGTF